MAEAMEGIYESPILGPDGRRLAVKAIDVGASDGSLLAGTIADANAQKMPDCEQYWLLYKKHPWVRTCVRIIANAVAQEGFAVVLIEGEDARTVTNADDPRVGDIHAFFRNSFTGKRARTFRQAVKALSVDLEIYGVGYWRRQRVSKTLVGLERLDPRLITPKLNAAKTDIQSFTLSKNRLSQTGVVVEQASSDDIPADEVIMFSLDEGGDVVLGSPSPLEALDLTTAMDLNVRQHRNSFFRNGATTGNVLINKEGEEDQVRAAEKQLMSMKVGPRRSYSNLVLTGDWDVKSLMQSGKHELDFIKGTDIARDEICAVYGVPPGKLIVSGGALGSAGKGEDDDTFEQECVLPLEELIYETITREILQGDFGIEDLALVPKRRNALRTDRIGAAKDLVTCGGTGNEARAMIGLPPISDPQYNMDAPLFVSHTAATVEDDEATRDTPAQPQDGDVPDNSDVQENEVAQKAKDRFRRSRFSYR